MTPSPTEAVAALCEHCDAFVADMYGLDQSYQYLYNANGDYLCDIDEKNLPIIAAHCKVWLAVRGWSVASQFSPSAKEGVVRLYEHRRAIDRTSAFFTPTEYASEALAIIKVTIEAAKRMGETE